MSELIIRTTDRDDGALYTCLAENEFGNDERKIRLLVMGNFIFLEMHQFYKNGFF